MTDVLGKKDKGATRCNKDMGRRSTLRRMTRGLQIVVPDLIYPMIDRLVRNTKQKVKSEAAVTGLPDLFLYFCSADRCNVQLIDNQIWQEVGQEGRS